MIRNQNGFTIMETLLAAAIATTIAYASFSIFPFLRAKEAASRGTAACNSYLATNFSRIELYGTAPRLEPAANSASYVTKMNSASHVVPTLTSPYAFNSNVGISTMSSQMSPNAGQPLVSFVDSNTVTEIRTSGLYTSSVLLIHALYSNNSAVCSSNIQFTSSDLNATTLLIPPPAEMQTGFNVQMEVHPYDVNSRAVLACNDPNASPSASSQIAPKGEVMSTTEADVTTPKPVAHFNTRNNVGYQVTLTANYQADDGAGNVINKFCKQTRQLEYTSDLTKPDPPTITITPTMTNNPTASGPATTTINFKYQNTVSKKIGVTLMCRDSSTWATPAYPPGKVPGSYFSGIPRRNQMWVPCEVVTACGIKQAGPANWGASTNASMTITSTWSGASRLPYGCTISIDVAAVDTAGNVSAIYGNTSVLNDPF